MCDRTPENAAEAALVAAMAKHINNLIEAPDGTSFECFYNETTDDLVAFEEDIRVLKAAVAQQDALIKRLSRRVSELEWKTP